MRSKRLWILPGVLLCVLIGLIIAAPALVPADKTAALIAHQVTKATGADVNLGSLRIHFWPRVHFELGSGSMTPKRKDSAVARVAWREINLNLAVGPLFRGRLEVGGVVIKGMALTGSSQGHRYSLDQAEIRGNDLHLRLGGQNPGTVPNLEVTFDLESQRLGYDGMTFSEVRGAGKADARGLHLETFAGVLAGGNIHGSADVDYGQPHKISINLDLQVRKVPASALLVDVAPELGSRWEGDLDGEAVGGWVIENDAFVRNSLDLKGEIRGTAGVIHAGDWLGDVSKYLHQRQDLKDIHYLNVKQPFTVHQGKYELNLVLNGTETDWTCSGWVGLDGNLNLDVMVALPPGFTPDLGALSMFAESLRDEENRLNLALTVTGQARRPRVALDLQRTLHGTGRNSSENLKKGLGGLLDKLKVK